ncbi:MAG: hypothetical protein IPJ65_22610 [Archangiaceae bacterium]|nr:hypothetical protein [Archangiaceae bacterium]
MPLLNAALLFLAAASEPAPAASLGPDAGFAPPDAGERGQIIEVSNLDAGSASVTVSPKVAVRITGMKSLPAEVLLDIIDLPVSAKPNDFTAREVARQAYDFLVRTGYELAQVSATVKDGAVELDVDEGQFERILFLGQLSFQQLRFKLAVSLPNDVFNRPSLDRQIRELSAAMNMTGVRWQLVRAGEVEHVGPQLTHLPDPVDLALLGAPLIHERRPYEIHVIFPEVEGAGLGIELKSGYIDGVETGVSYRLRNLPFEDDRAWAFTSVGIGARARVDTQKLYANFTRAVVELHYDLFPLGGVLRPGLWGQAELVSRQRPDLNLENYNVGRVGGALQVELELKKRTRLRLMGGFEWRRLWGYQTPDGSEVPAGIAVVDSRRPFVALTHDSVFNPEVLRWPRRHTLYGEVRVYLPILGQQPLAWADVGYQYVKAFGWHDLWVTAHGRAVWGDVTFHDESSVGEFTRGLFGNQFTRAAAGVQVEFRFSLTREVLKVGAFVGLAAMAVQPLRDENKLYAQLVESFGFSLHHLVLDMFQVDVLFAFGFRRGEFGFAPGVRIDKAF